jgi:hypothetical protein
MSRHDDVVRLKQRVIFKVTRILVTVADEYYL